jgi:hypothetical protein
MFCHTIDLLSQFVRQYTLAAFGEDGVGSMRVGLLWMACLAFLTSGQDHQILFLYLNPLWFGRGLFLI